MIVATKAIVISTLKYGDTSLIAKCFTATSGIKTYLLKGILSSKKGKIKTAYFQPLTILEIIANHKDKGTMETLKEVKISYPYQSIHSDIKKNALTFFLSEIMNTSIREEETNMPLFNYLETSLQWLDTHPDTSNFHILFLLNLTKYFGFYPDNSNDSLPFFDLLEGEFTDQSNLNTISDEDLTLLKSFLGIKFDNLHLIKMTKKQRHTLINLLITYFGLHLLGFKRPKSLAVLSDVFN